VTCNPLASLSRRQATYATLTVLVFVALLLRTVGTNHSFESSDNAENAARILSHRGYAWMAHEYYGLLLPLSVKVFAASLSSLGVSLNEFWWTLPIALLGTSMVLLVYFFLRRLGSGRFGAMSGAALTAVFPVFVMQSRYPWGYEIYGAFFLTVGLWALMSFRARPTMANGLLASFCCGVYLVSHGYILPSFALLVLWAFLFDPKGWAPGAEAETGPLWRKGVEVLGRLYGSYVWLFPLLLFPLYYYSLRHALRDKPTRLGFYLVGHLPGFVGNTGYLLGLLLVMAVTAGLFLGRRLVRERILLAAGGFLYFAPILFGAPPGITDATGYLLVGSFLWLLCLALTLDVLAEGRRKVVGCVVTVTVIATLAGTAEAVFLSRGVSDWTGVVAERGHISDPGTKAAGFLVQKYVSPAARVLAIHPAVEPPNLFYYFRRDRQAFYDLSGEDALARFRSLGGETDLVICSDEQAKVLGDSYGLVERMTVCRKGAPLMRLLSRREGDLPRVTIELKEGNEAFDREFSWKASFR